MFDALADIPASEIMRRDVLSLHEDDTVEEAVRIMDKNNCGSIVVAGKSGELAGIFTERDLLRRVIARGKNPKTTCLKEAMTQEVRHVQAGDNALILLELMGDQNFRHLPVLDGKKIVGIVSLKQFYKFFLESRKSLGV